MLVGASCTAELIQDDPGGLAQRARLPIPVVALELPSYSKKGIGARPRPSISWSAHLPAACAAAGHRARPGHGGCNILGPTALGFRHRDNVGEITGLLGRMGIEVRGDRADGRAAVRSRAARRGRLQRGALPGSRGTGGVLADAHLRPEGDALHPDRDQWDPGLRRGSGGAGGHRRGAGAGRRGGAGRLVCPLGRQQLPDGQAGLRLRRCDACGGRARVAAEEMGFKVVGLGTYSREFARDIREAAKLYEVEPLIGEDYLEVEAAIQAAQPELMLGTQMERHIAKRLGIPCAVISAPVHVQDYPARYSPQMGFEGANVLFDTWVHPLMMGLEEHLLGMFREDFEFHAEAAPSHLGGAVVPRTGGARRGGWWTCRPVRPAGVPRPRPS